MIIVLEKNRTRIRAGHSTYADVIATCNAGVIVEGSEVWIASTSKDQVRKGDKWLHVTRINGVPAKGWLALIHNGVVMAKPQEKTPKKAQNKAQDKTQEKVKDKVQEKAQDTQDKPQPDTPPTPSKTTTVKILKAVVTYSEDGVIKTETLVPE
jgi:hypothetical protein